MEQVYLAKFDGDCSGLVAAAYASKSAIDDVDRSSATTSISLRGADNAISQLNAVSAARDAAATPAVLPIVTAGVSDAREDLRGVTRDVRSLGNEIRGISSLDVSVGGGGAIRSLISDVNELGSRFASTASTASSALDEMRTGMAGASHEVGAMSDANEAAAKSLVTVGASADRSTVALNAHGQAAVTASAGMNAVTNSAGDMSEGMQQSAEATNAATRAQVSFGGATSDSTSRLGGLNAHLGGSTAGFRANSDAASAAAAGHTAFASAAGDTDQAVAAGGARMEAFAKQTAGVTSAMGDFRTEAGALRAAVGESSGMFSPVHTVSETAGGLANAFDPDVPYTTPPSPPRRGRGGGGGGGRGPGGRPAAGGEGDGGDAIDQVMHVGGLAAGGAMITGLATAATAAVGLGSVYEVMKQMPVAFSEAQMAMGRFDEGIYQSVAATELYGDDKTQIAAADKLKQIGSAIHDIGLEVGNIGMEHMNTALSAANDFVGQLVPALKQLDPAIDPAIKGLESLGVAAVQGFTSPGAVQAITALGNTLADPGVQQGISGLIGGAITSGGVLGTVLGHAAAAIGPSSGPVGDAAMDGAIAGLMSSKGSVAQRLAGAGVGGLLMGVGAYDQSQGVDPTGGFLAGGLGGLAGAATKMPGGALLGTAGGEAIDHAADAIDKQTGSNVVGDAIKGAWDFGTGAFALTKNPIAAGVAAATGATGAVISDTVPKKDQTNWGNVAKAGGSYIASLLQAPGKWEQNQPTGVGEAARGFQESLGEATGSPVFQGTPQNTTMSDILGDVSFAGRGLAGGAGPSGGPVPGPPPASGGAPGAGDKKLPVPDVDKDFFKGMPSGAAEDTHITPEGTLIHGKRGDDGSMTFDNTFQGGKTSSYSYNARSGVSTLGGQLPDGSGGYTGAQYTETRQGDVFGQGFDGSTTSYQDKGTAAGVAPPPGAPQPNLPGPGSSGPRPDTGGFMDKLQSAMADAGGAQAPSGGDQKTVSGRGALTPVAQADVGSGPDNPIGGQSSGGDAMKLPPDVPRSIFNEEPPEIATNYDAFGVAHSHITNDFAQANVNVDHGHVSFATPFDAQVSNFSAAQLGQAVSNIGAPVGTPSNQGMSIMGHPAEQSIMGPQQSPQQSQAQTAAINNQANALSNLASKSQEATQAQTALGTAIGSVTADAGKGQAAQTGLANAQTANTTASQANANASQANANALDGLANNMSAMASGVPGQMSSALSGMAPQGLTDALGMSGPLGLGSMTGLSGIASAIGLGPGSTAPSIGAEGLGAGFGSAAAAGISGAGLGAVAGAAVGAMGPAANAAAADVGSGIGASLGSGAGSAASTGNAGQGGAAAGDAGASGTGSGPGADSQSPSRKSYQVGLWIGEGLVVGMRESEPSVAKAGASVGRAGVDGANNVIAATAGSAVAAAANSVSQAMYDTELAGGFGAGLIAASNGVMPIAQDYGLMIGYSWAQNVVTGAQSVFQSSQFQALTTPAFKSALAQTDLGKLGLLPPAGSGAEYYTTTSGSAGMVQMAPVQVTNQIYLDGSLINTTVDTKISTALDNLTHAIGAQTG